MLWWWLACAAPAPEVTLWVGGEVAVHPLPLAALGEVAGPGPAVLPVAGGAVAPPSLWVWPAHGETSLHRSGEAQLALVGVDLRQAPLPLAERIRAAGGDHQLVLVRGGEGVLVESPAVQQVVREAQLAEAEAVVFTSEGAQAVRREGRMVVVYGTGPLWTGALAEPPQAVVVDLTVGGGHRPRAVVRPVRAGGPVLGPEPHPRPMAVLDAMEVQGATDWTRQTGLATLE